MPNRRFEQFTPIRPIDDPDILRFGRLTGEATGLKIGDVDERWLTEHYAKHMAKIDGRFTQYAGYSARDLMDVAVRLGKVKQDGAMEISSIAVDRYRRGNGIGSWAIDQIATVARSGGATALELSSVRTAESFYRKVGFEALGFLDGDEGLMTFQMKL